ncbi:helicase [Trypanosoma rangeli]|uniref:ATP-dependent RNA helicase n=1 Tax=Trypanosoma rangeli TaxID=5698 RepID=A0A3R7LSE5_TRYRA|nr:helicase [Trypanosoma rangeli]RNF02432.1 helicase [Trypanosoma rangeli]|eukprot:RNF02432.1 helicase [Trypanosoma rangeli]
MMERTVRACDAYVTEHNRPLLRRDIIGIVVSPSRILAEQTFVVGRNLASRYPHTIRFALCDGAVQSIGAALDGLKKAARGAGTFLVTTPHDLSEFIAAWEQDQISGDAADDMQELLDAQDEETRRHYYEKRGGKTSLGGDTGSAVQLRGCNTERFAFVVDEADLVFHSPEMRDIVTRFIDTHAWREEPPAKRRKPSHSASSSPARIAMDMAFVGATVSTSQKLQEYAAHINTTLGTKMHTVVLNTSQDFVTQLQNRYVVCGVHEFLPLLVQLMNLHASRKHFIFFNSSKTLRFVEKLFAALTDSESPLLYIKQIFVMYDGMNERARLEQYNAFLNHKTNTQESAKSKSQASPFSAAEKKNQVYRSGWKRDGRPPDGKGAILLCTDMAAFGLDVRDVDYVYHFEPPTTVQSYVHRIGRVGRMGMRGSSILLLPCFGNETALASTRERKTTSTRFNTVTNTKFSTSELQTLRVTTDDLTKEQNDYLSELGKRSELQSYSLPPFAPITSTIRNIISQQKKLLKLAQIAAMSMCTVPQDAENAKAWFDPKLALHALLLD